MLIPEVAKRLADRSDVVFVLCGEGVMREGLESAAKHLQNMQVIPLQPFERLGDLLGVADIHLLPQSPRASDLVLPSKLSGMLASGRPVIATCNPGTELDAVVSKCGVVVPPEDSRALAEAVVNLADNATLRSELGRKARAYAEYHFEQDTVLRQMFGPLGSSGRRAVHGPRGVRRVLRRVLGAVLASVAAGLLLPATWLLGLLVMPTWRARG
jgi:colanic acid biosynthesis glycosyl transferase WcaI